MRWLVLGILVANSRDDREQERDARFRNQCPLLLCNGVALEGRLVQGTLWSRVVQRNEQRLWKDGDDQVMGYFLIVREASFKQ